LAIYTVIKTIVGLVKSDNVYLENYRVS